MAPNLARRLTTYEVLVIVTALAGSVLGAVQEKTWIPVAVAFGALLSAFLQYEGLQGRLAAMNAAIRELSELDLQWRNFGVVEKRTRSVKSLLVHVTEAAVLSEAVAYVAGAAQAKVAPSAISGLSPSADNQVDASEKKDGQKTAGVPMQQTNK